MTDQGIRAMLTERGVLLIATGILFLASIALFATAGELPEEARGALSILLWPPGFTVAGAIITGRLPRHAVGRLLMWAGMTAGLNTLGLGLQARTGLSLETLEGWQAILGTLISVWWVLPIIFVFAAMARFPDGAWTTPWVARFFWLFAASFAGQVPLGFVAPETAASMAGILSGVSAVSVAVMLVLIIVQLIRSDPVRRRQFAWVGFGLLLSLVASLVPLSVDAPDWIGANMLLLFPASLVVAVTRYRLYEIDRIVSRTVTYVVVVGLLGAVYAGLVLALRSVVPVEGPLPVALSTLAVAFAFFPLLRRVQAVVDRRFFRSRYDAAGVVAAFADELRSTLDPEVAAGRAESVVGETFQAESVSVWLAEEPA